MEPAGESSWGQGAAGSLLGLVGMDGCGGESMQTKMFPDSGCLLF